MADKRKPMKAKKATQKISYPEKQELIKKQQEEEKLKLKHKSGR